MPQARALVQAAQLQQQHLQQISSNLPQHLPSFNTAPQAGSASTAAAGSAGAAAVTGVRGPAAATAGADDAVKGGLMLHGTATWKVHAGSCHWPCRAHRPLWLCGMLLSHNQPVTAS